MPAFRQAATTGAAGIGGGNLLAAALGAPALANSLLLCYAYYANSGAPTAPAGFTLLRSGGTGTGLFYVWYKIAAGGEQNIGPTTTGSNNHLSLVVAEYTGVSTTSPFDGEAENSTTAYDGNAITAPSVAPAAASGLLVAFFGAVVGSAGNTWTPPAGMTERVDYQASSASVELADLAVGAGATGTKTATSGYDPGTNPHTGHSLVLRRSNAAPGAPGAPSVAPSPVNTNGTISYTAAVDPDGDAVTYDVELSTNNGGSWAVIVAGTASLAPVYNFAAQPTTTTAKLRVRAKDSLGLYGAYATMAGTFTIVHNVAPTAATGLTPDGGTAVDRAQVQRLAWTFNDPDPGDTQSKFDLRWRQGVGAWTTITQTTTTPYYDAPAATFPVGSVEWQVMPYDAQGLPATAWSASAFFTAATAPATPAITSPANNSAQGAPTGLLAWSAPTQDAYQVRKVADNAGVANTSVVYYDTGTVVSSSARDAPLDFPTNNRTEHLQVRIRVGGLWSTWSSVKVNVAWSPPAVPTIVTTARADLAAIDVAVTNPAPVGTQPVLATTELWRRRVGGTETLRLAAVVVGGSYRDVTPASGVAYEYQAVAIGTTGTKQASAWTP